MKIASHQPNYLPNLGYFYKMANVDRFVIFTNAQFSKGDGWVRRHKIQGPNKDLWLTVPVISSGEQQIKEVMIDNSHKWRHSHKASIHQAYAKTEEKEALEAICAVYEQKWDRLADLNIALIRCVRDILGLKAEIVVDEEVHGEKQFMIINVCEKHDGDKYLSGMGGKIYMTEEFFSDFESRNIELNFVEKDLTGQYPYTLLHYLFTEGKEWVLEQLTAPVGVQEPALAAA